MSLVIKVLVDDQAVQATSAQAKLLKVAINNLQNDIRKTADMGVPIAKEAEDRLKKLRAQYEKVQEMRDQIKEQDRTPMMLRKQERMEERIGKGVARVFGGGLAQKIIRGEKIEGGDIFREIMGGERLAMRLAKAAGISDATMLEVAPLIPLVAEAATKTMEGFQIAAEEKKEAQKIGREYVSGGMSQQEFDLFQRQTEKFFGSPKETLEKAQKAADAFSKLSDNETQNIIDQANQSDQTQSALTTALNVMTPELVADALNSHFTSLKIRPQTLNDVINEGMKKIIGVNVKSARDIHNRIQELIINKRNELGVAELNSAEHEKIVRGAFIDAGFSEEMQNKLIKAGEAAQESSKKSQLSASHEFRKDEIRIQQELGFQLRNKRIPANPVDF